MLGAGLQFNRSRNGEDRFYSAARARRSRNQSQSQDYLRRAQSDVIVSRSPQLPEAESPAGAIAVEEKPAAVEVSKKATLEPSCNLERFLQSITPSVTAQYLSKTTMRGWRTCDVEFQSYFVLGDLWDFFKEWSAYGAGVPLILNDCDSVVEKIQDNVEDFSPLGPLIHWAVSLKENFNFCIVPHVGRAGNSAAHVLAKTGFSAVNRLEGWDNFPEDLMECIFADME